MTLQASAIITPVRATLLDATGVTWTDAELIGYLNAGVTQLVGLKPDANSVENDVDLVPGVAQALPANGVLFMDCIRNSTGNRVTVQPIHEFVRTHPTWARDAADINTVYVLFDPRLPRNFWVWPPAPSDDGMHLPVMYGATPTRIAALTDEIGVPDYWEFALGAFVLARAYAKNSRRHDIVKSKEFMDRFLTLVGGTTQTERLMAGRADVEGKQ